MSASPIAFGGYTFPTFLLSFARQNGKLRAAGFAWLETSQAALALAIRAGGPKPVNSGHWIPNEWLCNCVTIIGARIIVVINQCVVTSQ